MSDTIIFNNLEMTENEFQEFTKHCNIKDLYIVGRMYLGNELGEKYSVLGRDIEKAFYFMEQSSNNGYGKATTWLAFCYECGSSSMNISKDIRKALSLYKKAYDHGYFESDIEKNNCKYKIDEIESKLIHEDNGNQNELIHEDSENKYNGNEYIRDKLENIKAKIENILKNI